MLDISIVENRESVHDAAGEELEYLAKWFTKRPVYLRASSLL
jgi:hypothetical protein